ncbi:MAG: VapC toxin family PIN domain ribonuclease [Phormidesmis priestleyi]|uniref:VapC toxin family PIN domain ribonuclease n=1 Tax=Phormidesmis priestleyi TaxID=268141 RepID=A0A2W4XKT9_9CYAN|nr:MAG: VapC toxin family PIN domain ribonuclease [Phormidesmis priestleyi]
MILVDSSVWISYFNGVETSETDLLDKLLGTVPIAIGDLILVEVLQGFRQDKDYEIAQQLLLSLQIFNLLDREMALKVAQNYRSLRKKGITICKTADVIIATFCIEKSLPLLHADKDFKPFEAHLGLKTPLND